jgi:hypothetical protein
LSMGTSRDIVSRGSLPHFQALSTYGKVITRTETRPTKSNFIVASFTPKVPP